MAIKIQNTTVIDDSKSANLLNLTIAQDAGTGASYLKIPIYTDVAARAAAIPSPQQGMIAFTAGVFEGYDGTQWASLAGPEATAAFALAIIAL